MDMPLHELERRGAGIEVTYADAGDRDGSPSVTYPMLQGHDVIVAQRWNTHKGLGVWRRARSPYSRLVYELDDDVLHITPDNWGAYHLYGKPEVRDAVIHGAETADLITVSTEPLAQVMREYNGNVAVLPNAIPGWVLALPRVQRGRPRIGWTGGASHGVDIGLVADPVRRFLKRFGGWDLHLGGTDYRPTFQAPAGRVHYEKWVQVNEDPEGFYSSIDFDIGLCPVWPTTFSDSKSAVKAIEYGARGIPAICSDVPAYRPVIEHGVNGFLVKHDHEWLKYASELAGDEGLRAKMGEAARDMARRHLIEDRWTDWEAAYRGLFR
jgi:glycosyltransferase involved in cell wall biosynthesis